MRAPSSSQPGGSDLEHHLWSIAKQTKCAGPSPSVEWGLPEQSSSVAFLQELHEEPPWNADGWLMAFRICGRRITLWSKSTFPPSQKGDGSEGCRKPRWLSPFSALALLSRLHSLFVCCMWLEGCCWPWRTYSVSHFDDTLCLFCYSAAETQWKLILAYCSYCSKHSRILCPDCPRKIPFHFSPIL